MSASRIALVHVHDVVLAVYNPGAGEAPPGAAKLETLLRYGAWLMFAACVAGVLYAAGKMAIEHRHGGGGGEGTTRLIWALVAAVVGASASALVGAMV